MAPHGPSFAQHATYSAWEDNKAIKEVKASHRVTHELVSHLPEEKEVDGIMSAALSPSIESVPSPSYRVVCKTPKLSAANSEGNWHSSLPDGTRRSSVYLLLLLYKTGHCPRDFYLLPHVFEIYCHLKISIKK